MPGTYWNDAPHDLLPHGPLDLYMTAALWIEEPTTACTGNTLCCSPSPVVGIWSRIDWQRPESACPPEDPGCGAVCTALVPRRSYAENTCYNMKGFWCELPEGSLLAPVHTERARLPVGHTLPDYALDVSPNREPRWMAGEDLDNLGPMNWATIRVRSPVYTGTDRRFFVLCPGTRRQTLACLETSRRLEAQLEQLRALWQDEQAVGDEVRMDLENEVVLLQALIGDFKTKYVEIQGRMDAKLYTARPEQPIGISRSMFFKSPQAVAPAS